jgi:hypothetical protein
MGKRLGEFTPPFGGVKLQKGGVPRWENTLFWYPLGGYPPFGPPLGTPHGPPLFGLFVKTGDFLPNFGKKCRKFPKFRGENILQPRLEKKISEKSEKKYFVF